MKRFRQFRTDEKVRDRFAETRLYAADFILPCFVIPGGKSEDIPGFDGVRRLCGTGLLREAERALKLGIERVILFGAADAAQKDASGSRAASGPVTSAVTALKKNFPRMTVITDICLCGFTTHGHCGVLRNGAVDNDATLPLLSAMALSHAAAGADIVTPSSMMDGQVAAIRRALNAKGHKKVKILAYSAKYASNFYGPFRGAAKSAPASGDRKAYQMDYRNTKQAMDEIKADLDEGADAVMVKPAAAYLDVISGAAGKFPGVPLAAYQVSGEYMMLKAGAEKGLYDEKEAFLETLTAIKRAGAGSIITYYAKEAAGILSPA